MRCAPRTPPAPPLRCFFSRVNIALDGGAVESAGDLMRRLREAAATLADAADKKVRRPFPHDVFQTTRNDIRCAVRGV